MVTKGGWSQPIKLASTIFGNSVQKNTCIQKGREPLYVLSPFRLSTVHILIQKCLGDLSKGFIGIVTCKGGVLYSQKEQDIGVIPNHDRQKT